MGQNIYFLCWIPVLISIICCSFVSCGGYGPDDQCYLEKRATLKGGVPDDFCMEYDDGEYRSKFSRESCDDGLYLICCDDTCKCCTRPYCPDVALDGDDRPTCYNPTIPDPDSSEHTCSMVTRASTKGSSADQFCEQYIDGDFRYEFAEEDCYDGGYLVCCDGTCQCCDNEYCPDEEYDANGNPICYKPTISGAGSFPGERVVAARNASGTNQLKIKRRTINQTRDTRL
ncbi:unnamed protein product [Orchesella dallaii]|uniref:Uncharacterized protein n=1 Tax=Orchesella dallaii TaxID=48710 RepID=A0ABP1QCW0_9HEXA